MTISKTKTKTVGEQKPTKVNVITKGYFINCTSRLWQMLNKYHCIAFELNIQNLKVKHQLLVQSGRKMLVITNKRVSYSHGFRLKKMYPR